MITLQTIYHKKNEIQEVEFFKDAKCTEAFDFTNAKNLYIQPVNGDCTQIFALSNKLSGLGIKARIFTPIWHLGWRDGISPQTPLVTLNDVLDGEDSNNVNLSKYIPEDNAVLFLSEEDVIFQPKVGKGLIWKSIAYSNHKGNGTYRFREIPYPEVYETLEDLKNRVIINKITIFLPHGTQSEIQKAKEVEKELREKDGVEEVNLIMLHSLVTKYKVSHSGIKYYVCSYDALEILSNFNKIITTNSTGILKLEDSNERLQVIDAKEIFEEYLNENNLI